MGKASRRKRERLGPFFKTFTVVDREGIVLYRDERSFIDGKPGPDGISVANIGLGETAAQSRRKLKGSRQ